MPDALFSIESIEVGGKYAEDGRNHKNKYYKAEHRSKTISQLMQSYDDTMNYATMKSQTLSTILTSIHGACLHSII